MGSEMCIRDRCDNSGENKDLQEKCLQSKDLNDIKFEYTPRDSPQFNGCIERKFAVVYSRMQVNFEAARINKEFRTKPWGEACMAAIDVENALVPKSKEESPYKMYYKKNMPKVEMMRQFGEMAVIKVTKAIKGKLENRGIPVMYLGRAKDHAADAH